MTRQPTNPNKPTIQSLLYEAERKLVLFNETTRTMKMKFDFNHFDPDEDTVRRTVDLVDLMLENARADER
jgi:hypothetical protein